MGADNESTISGCSKTVTSSHPQEGQQPARLRLATLWLSGCSGCHMSLLYTDGFLLELARAADLVYSPLADGGEIPERIDLMLVEGGVGTGQDRERALAARARSRRVVSLGDCAITGNVPALRNPIGPEAVIREAYGAEWRPEGLPRLLPAVLPLHQVIPVDLFVPGCPPDPERIRTVLTAIIRGEEPQLPREMLLFG